jgi:DNA repair and recombination protein RAD52
MMNKEELNKKLDPKHIKSRSKGGTNLSYVEGWHTIAEANRIFDFDGWKRETIYCREVCRYDYKVGKGQYEKDGFKVGYEAKVKITVGEAEREGTGHGSGIASDLYDAIEMAAKEAETDAMKRALMTFGNPFGLALYDKYKTNVGVPEVSPEDKLKAATAFVDGYLKQLVDVKTKDELLALQTKNSAGLDSIRNKYQNLNEHIIKITKELKLND